MFYQGFVLRPVILFEFLWKLLWTFFPSYIWKCWPDVLYVGRCHCIIGLLSLFVPTVVLGRNAGDLICKCQQIHFDHHFSSIQNWYWPSLNFICLDHVVKFDCSCRSGCFQVLWYLFFWFTLFSMSWCNRRVSLRRKMQHRWVLPLLLTIMSGRGRVILR